MHILIASPYLPWPLTEGGRAAQYRTFEALRDSCTFTLVVPIYGQEEEANVRHFSAMFPNVTVEAVRNFYIPPPLSRRTRLRRMAGRLLRAIIPPAKSIYSIQPPENPSDPCPFYPFACHSPDFVNAVEKHLVKGCDIFQVEFADMLSLGPFIAGRVPTLFVHHQLHFVYARRFLEANRVTGANARYLTARIVREEAIYLSAFDSIIVFSEVDRQSLMEYCPHLTVNISPFPSPEELIPVEFSFHQEIRHFVFVASAGRTNMDGFVWFMEEVWPAIKNRIPDAVIEVIGKWSHAAQISLPNNSDIRFAGYVPELGQALRNKIMVVPLWVGSGIRTKILAAWGASCPVVTTTVGVEGLPGKAGDHFLIADDAAEFARTCVALTQNIDMLNRLAANGLELVQKNYSLAAVRKTRLEIYESLIAASRES